MSNNVFSDGAEVLLGPLSVGSDPGKSLFFIVKEPERGWVVLREVCRGCVTQSEFMEPTGITYGPKEIDYKAAMEKVAGALISYPETGEVFLKDVGAVVEAAREAGLLDSDGRYVGGVEGE